MISRLGSVFSLKDLGTLSYFLGIEATRDNQDLLLTQKKYVDGLLSKASMSNCEPVATPMVSSSHLSAFGGEKFTHAQLYRSIVGALQYVCITRTDLSFCVNKVCQFMHASLVSHRVAVKRILRYLKGTSTTGLFISKSANQNLVAYSDADWASNVDDRKSTSGFCIFMGSNLVSWSAKKQATLARSSTDAEYHSASSAAAELVWLQNLIGELKVDGSQVPVLWCNNLSSIALINNPVFHARAKHIELDHHFIRERVLNGQLSVGHVPSTSQLADIFTKLLSQPHFEFFRNKLLTSA